MSELKTKKIMLLKIYIPILVLVVWIRVVFVETESTNSANDNLTEYMEVEDVSENSTKNNNNSAVQLSKRQERMEEAAEMRKGKGSKGGKGVSDDLCRKFLYLLPLLTIAPILLLIWKFPKHESHHHSYTPYHGETHTHHKGGHGGHGGGHGWMDQNYYKKLDESVFDFYRQPLAEQGLPA